MSRLTINEQAQKAVESVNGLFSGTIPPIPEGATLESLWLEVCRQKGCAKKPRKVEAIKLILEDPQLDGLTIPLIADIIKRIFLRHDIPCDTSDSSIRWYISQKTLEWNIVPRSRKMSDLDINALTLPPK
jgi:hypothetical protein